MGALGIRESRGFDAKKGRRHRDAPIAHAHVDRQVMAAKLPAPCVRGGRFAEEGQPVVVGIPTHSPGARRLFQHTFRRQHRSNHVMAVRTHGRGQEVVQGLLLDLVEITDTDAVPFEPEDSRRQVGPVPDQVAVVRQYGCFALSYVQLGKEVECHGSSGLDLAAGVVRLWGANGVRGGGITDRCLGGGGADNTRLLNRFGSQHVLGRADTADNKHHAEQRQGSRFQHGCIFVMGSAPRQLAHNFRQNDGATDKAHPPAELSHPPPPEGHTPNLKQRPRPAIRTRSNDAVPSIPRHRVR